MGMILYWEWATISMITRRSGVYSGGGRGAKGRKGEEKGGKGSRRKEKEAYIF